MNPEYIRKIEELLSEVRKKQMDPVGKADADIDNDGDVDSSDKYLHKRRKAIAKSMKKEGEGKVTKCGACEGSTENHDPECPKAKSEACGDYGKKVRKEENIHYVKVGDGRDHMIVKTKADKPSDAVKKLKAKYPKHKVAIHKEEVEQVAEYSSANHTVYGHKADGTKKVIGRAHGDDADSAVKNFHNSPNNGQFKSVYKGFSAKRDHVEYDEVDNNLSEVSANHSVYGHKADGTKKVIGRAHGSDEKEAISNFHSSPNNGQFKSVYKGFSAKRDHVEYRNQPVVSEQWGFGEVIEATASGLNVYFEHGVEFDVPVYSLTFLEDKKHTKGATGPEGLLDKESPRSKQFVKDHEKSDKEIEDKEMKGHEDATKAGRVTKQAPARPGEKRVGDTKIVNPVKGAVTQTTGKE